MNIKNRNQIYSTIAIVAVVAVAVGFAVNQQLTTATTTVGPTPIIGIDFTVETPSEDPIIMKKGEIRTIPLNIMAPRDKPLNLKVGVVAENDDTLFISTGQQKLPEGISAVLDKANVNLPAEAVKSDLPRDQIQMTLSISPSIKTGLYTLGIVLVTDDQGTGHPASVTKYLRIQVQE